MELNAIVAIGENNEIGSNNKLLWNLPADMKHFREITTGHTVIMGRKTFESLPKGALPNRKNIVISKNKNLIIENVTVINSIEDIFKNIKQNEKLFIIGGAEIYKQTFPLISYLYITRIHESFPQADTFFPIISPEEWLIFQEKKYISDEKNAYNYSFIEYKKK